MKKLLFAILILPILGCTELSVENDNLSEGIELSIEYDNISEKIESEIRLLLEDVSLISLSKRLMETQDSLTSEVINSVLTEKEKTAFSNFNLFITTSHEDIFKEKYNSEFYLLFDDYSSVIFDDLLLKM